MFVFIRTRQTLGHCRAILLPFAGLPNPKPRTEPPSFHRWTVSSVVDFPFGGGTRGRACGRYTKRVIRLFVICLGSLLTFCCGGRGCYAFEVVPEPRSCMQSATGHRKSYATLHLQAQHQTQLQLHCRPNKKRRRAGRK